MNQYGICHLSLIPVRKEPSDRSEMITQVLCGETYELIEIQDNWSYIRIYSDSYEGWINNKLTSLIAEDHFHDINHQSPYILKDAACHLTAQPELTLSWIPGGACFIWHNSALFLGNTQVIDLPETSTYPVNKNSDIPTDAMKYIHSPYLWGGKSIFGIDCSGFTQVVFKMNGINIPRDAYQQAEIGILQSFEDEIRAGDLAFFKREDSYIVHTGIMLSATTIIHASGQVRIDNIDEKGIIHSQSKKYSHQLSHFRRITKNHSKTGITDTLSI